MLFLVTYLVTYYLVCKTGLDWFQTGLDLFDKCIII